LNLLNPPADADVNNRLDLTHQKIYTIDDESTEEIDDGLSVEILWMVVIVSGFILPIPSRLVLPDDELDLEARRRSTIFIFPRESFPCFP
jgi:exoribonuclease-2